MGTTLPLLVRALAPSSGSVAPIVGRLFGLNTLGAAAGCCFVGFIALPRLGFSTTNLMAAFASCSIGAGAMLMSRWTYSPSPPDGKAATRAVSGCSDISSTDGCPRAAAFVAGVGGLTLEIVWFRPLALVLGPSTYAFSSMLAMLLFGIALGGIVYRRLRHAFSAVQSFALFVVGLVVVATVIGQLALPALTDASGLLRPVSESPWGNGVFCLAVSACLVGMATIAMGTLLPLLSELPRANSAGPGRQVGGIYAWNTAGNDLAAAAVPAYLVPAYGTQRALAGGLMMYVVALALIARLATRAQRIAGAITAGACVCWVALGRTPADVRLTNSGAYLYGYTPRHELLARDLLYFSEGSSASILVTSQGGNRALRIDGKVDAGSAADMKMQLGLAYFPRFLKPGARTVLNVGFGSGTTAGASLLFPQTKVTCCELERAVYDAGRFFSDVNHRPFASPDFSIVIDDARAFLAQRGGTFELILSEPSNPWMAGVSKLFTREFYVQASARLAPSGLFAQWVQTYNFATEDFLMVLATLRSVFDHCWLIRVSQSDTIVIASRDPIGVSADEIEVAQGLVDSSKDVCADLERFYGLRDVRSLLLTRVIMDDKGINGWLAAREARTINTDRNLRLEFDAPRRLFSFPRMGAALTTALANAYNPELSVRLFRNWGCAHGQLAALAEIVGRLDFTQRRSDVLVLCDLALSQDGGDPFFSTVRAILDAGRGRSAERTDMTDDCAMRLASMGRGLSDAGNHTDACVVFERILRARPGATIAWTNLGLNYAALHRVAEARSALDQALRLDPTDGFIHDALNELPNSPAAPE